MAARGGRVETEIVEALDRDDPLVAEWDRLAVASRRPLAAPAFALPWWKHCAPQGSQLRVVAVRRDERVVGVAPYFAQRGPFGRVDYRLLGSGLFHRIGPLAEPAVEAEVAAAVARALHHATPAPSLVTLEGVASTPPWGELLAAAYPGPLRPRRYTSSRHHAPVVRLAGLAFDEWLAAKSRNFRQQMRSHRRRAETEHITWRAATADSLERDLGALVRLHEIRWRADSGGVFARPGPADALRETASWLLGSGRLRLWLVEQGDAVLGAQLFGAAGGEVAYWNGGWDPAAASVRPGLLGMLAAIEDACGRGDERLDLGGGRDSYKLRFADADDPISFGGFMPRTRRYPVTRALLLPQEIGWRARPLAKRLLRRSA